MKSTFFSRDFLTAKDNISRFDGNYSVLKFIMLNKQPQEKILFKKNQQKSASSLSSEYHFKLQWHSFKTKPCGQQSKFNSKMK